MKKEYKFVDRKNKKNLWLIISAISLILVASTLVFLKLQGFDFNINGMANRIIPSTCTDSDGGINYNQYGTVDIRTKSYTDYCSGTSNLYERYCRGGSLGTKRYRCPSGCSNGACKIQNKSITIKGTYSGFYNFPKTFFDGSKLSPKDVVKVTDRIYLLEVELANGKLLYNSFIKGTYNKEVYGSTTPEGFVLGDLAAPINNNGHHSWDVIAHEVGHGFWANSNFYYTIAVPGPFLQEATAVLTAQYVYERIKSEQNHFNLSLESFNSLNAVFEQERAYQKSRYEEYLDLGKPYSQDESTPYAILTSQAMGYQWFLIGDQYGWEKFSRFYKSFSDDLKNSFIFWQDGVSDSEETTYMVAALSASFNQNFRQNFIDLNFPVDDGLYNEIYPKIKDYLDEYLDIQIPVDPGFPPGGVSYINWEFENNFERLDVDVNIIKFDTSKYLYLQFYQSTIGDDGFYFGIQNRVDENDQMLIFSRWGTRDLADVKVNSAKGGFSQSAGYEGDFVGIRLPNFNLKNGEYIFSIIKDQDDDGSWYKYIVTDKSTGIQTWGGSIRFDKGAKISKLGGTWTELYGVPWPIQTYRYLPTWDVEIKSIKGSSILPLHATSSYSDPNWGDHIPMEDISYDPIAGSIRIQLGPYVVRKNDAGRII